MALISKSTTFCLPFDVEPNPATEKVNPEGKVRFFFFSFNLIHSNSLGETVN